MELPQKIHPLRRDPYWLLKYLKLLVLNLIFVSVFAYGLIFYQDMIPQILKSYNLHYIVPGLILLYIGVWKTLKLEGKRKKETFKFMEDRLVVKEGFGIEDSGFLAFIFFQEVSTDDIPYSQITHVNVEESMEQQFGFIGTGNLEIYRPGAMRRGKGEESDVEQGEERIMLRGVKDPHKWERLIMEGDPEVLEEYEES